MLAPMLAGHARWASPIVTGALAKGEYVVPLPYSRWLLRSCGQFSLMTLGAAAHRRWGCCFLAFCCFVAGLNYWRKATYGLRRHADMAAVVLTLLYHSAVAFGLLGAGCAAARTALLVDPQRPLLGVGPWVPALGPAGYLLLTVAFIAMYCRARWFASRNEFHRSTPWHLAVHVTGNLGNLLMYPGLK
ncbi:unnamed protein product [Effrenium voratum]|nr:unnamed protein product [Effrenium voratum]